MGKTVLSGEGENFEDEELLKYFINRESEEVNDNEQVNNKNDISIILTTTFEKVKHIFWNL